MQARPGQTCFPWLNPESGPRQWELGWHRPLRTKTQPIRTSRHTASLSQSDLLGPGRLELSVPLWAEPQAACLLSHHPARPAHSASSEGYDFPSTSATSRQEKMCAPVISGLANSQEKRKKKQKQRNDNKHLFTTCLGLFTPLPLTYLICNPILRSTESQGDPRAQS